MKLTVSNAGVPVGSYLAKFVGVEPTSNEIGEGIRWIFEVTNGPQRGQRCSRITNAVPTLKNACGKILAGLGAVLVAGAQVDIDGFVGATFLIVVAQTDSGATRVESVSPPPAV